MAQLERQEEESVPVTDTPKMPGPLNAAKTVQTTAKAASTTAEKAHTATMQALLQNQDEFRAEIRTFMEKLNESSLHSAPISSAADARGSAMIQAGQPAQPPRTPAHEPAAEKLASRFADDEPKQLDVTVAQMALFLRQELGLSEQLTISQVSAEAQRQLRCPNWTDTWPLWRQLATLYGALYGVQSSWTRVRPQPPVSGEPATPQLLSGVVETIKAQHDNAQRDREHAKELMEQMQRYASQPAARCA
eukprot:COSAG01_NODE_81_length_27820_cov_22.659753_28_plen_248_part_00